MKLVSYLKDEQDQLAMLVDGMLYNMDEIHPNLPGSMGMFLNYWDDFYPQAIDAEQAILNKRFLQNRGISPQDVSLLSPVPFPASLRLGFGFEQHLANIGLLTAPGSNLYPMMAFGNHHSMKGAGTIACMPDYLQQLDFELQAAAVICRPGRNIAAETADYYIGGLMIMNSFCARQLQGKNAVLGLAEAKGKDLATAAGPFFVTLDELELSAIPAKNGHIGKTWNLRTSCSINGKAINWGNLGNMDWTFAEMIERASYGVQLYPGDIISSGTITGGCLLEFNKTHEETWLKPGDTLEVEIDQLGCLSNSIEREASSWSIFK